MADFRYLFAANDYTSTFMQNKWLSVSTTFTDGMWMGSLFYPLALVMVLIAALRPRTWRDPVFSSLFLWVAGYFAFMAYHTNVQPRYFLAVAVPLTLLMVRSGMHLAAWHPLAAYPLVPALVLLTTFESRITLRYVRHPEYSFQLAADAIGRIVQADPTHSHTVLSISGSNLTLMTGVPSICDDFGTMQLEDRIAVYRPGWFVTWNYVEDDKMQALAKFYQLTRIAELPAMDDPERNQMIVYRLDPKQGITPRRKARTRKPGNG